MSVIDVTVQNVQALPPMPQEYVVADVTDTASVSDIILWQEINKMRYRSAVKNLGPEWGHLLVGGMGNIGGCPISWLKSRYAMVQRGKIKLSKSWPGICGTRYITWVLLRDLESGAVIFVHNFHYPAGAWSPKKQLMRKRRQRMWLKGNKIHRELVKEWVREGYPVIGGGDVNRMFCSVVGDSVGGFPVGYATSGSIIDELFFIESDEVKLILSKSNSYDRYSDHKSRSARLLVKKVK